MNFWELYNIVENASEQPYHVRWMIQRDIPEVVRLLENHPDFEGENYDGINTSITRLLGQRNCIGMVAESKEDNVIGVMIYYLRNQSLEMPLIAGVNQPTVEMLLDRALEKIGPLTRREALHVRTHFNMDVLKALKAKGFATQSQGDWVVATAKTGPKPPRDPNPNASLEPADNVDPHETPNWNDYYQKIGSQLPSQAPQPEAPGTPEAPETPSYYEPPEPEKNTQQDPWGLFKNKAWQDKPPEDEEYA